MSTDTEPRMITLVVDEREHDMLLQALDKKIWSLIQTGLPGAYRQVPAFKKLRAEVADVQSAPSETNERDTSCVTDVR